MPNVYGSANPQHNSITAFEFFQNTRQRTLEVNVAHNFSVKLRNYDIFYYPHILYSDTLVTGFHLLALRFRSRASRSLRRLTFLQHWEQQMSRSSLVYSCLIFWGVCPALRIQKDIGRLLLLLLREHQCNIQCSKCYQVD